MTYSEFRDQVVPSVLELQKKCSKMSEAEFNEFRKDAICEAGKQKLSTQFMTVAFDLIYAEENASLYGLICIKGASAR